MKRHPHLKQASRPERAVVGAYARRKREAARRGWAVAAWVALIATLVWLACGCTSTVIPVTVKPAAASLDGNVANSGFLQFNKDGAGLITPHARDRYNALLQLYGARFSPSLAVDAGVKPDGAGNFIIDAEHLAKFAQMNRWRKEGK